MARSTRRYIGTALRGALYSLSYLLFVVCCKINDNIQGVYHRPKLELACNVGSRLLLKINKIVSIVPNYQDVYEDDVIKLKYIAEVLIENIRNKEDIENIEKEKEGENEEKVCR